MKLSQAMSRIKGSDGEKTAAEKTPAAKDAPTEKTAANGEVSDRLKRALEEATKPKDPAQEKQAGALAGQGSPVDGLMKTATEIAASEMDALVKEAHIYGAAVYDGMVARAAQYEAAGQKLGAAAPAPETVKNASAEGGFEKFAAENPEMVKEAASLGYATTIAQMDKLAQAAYVKGHNDATLAVYKLAHASFCQGFQNTVELLKEIGK